MSREYLERMTVESRVAEDDDRSETLEDHDVDMAELHRPIVENGVVEGRGVVENDDVEGQQTDDQTTDEPSRKDQTTDDVLAQYDIESTLSADGRIETSFVRERTVEEEVVERSRLRADVTEREFQGLEREAVEVVDASTEPLDSGNKTAASTGTASREETGPGEEATVAEVMDADIGESTFTDEEVGKPVVDTAGLRIGLVTDIEDAGAGAYVQANPGIARRIRAALGWGDRDEESTGLSPASRCSPRRRGCTGGPDSAPRRPRRVTGDCLRPVIPKRRA